MQPEQENKRGERNVLRELLTTLNSGKTSDLPVEIQNILNARVVAVKSIGKTNYLLVDSAITQPGFFSLVIIAPDGATTDVKALTYTFHPSLPDKIRRSDADGWTEKFAQLVPESYAAYLETQRFTWDSRHREPEEPLHEVQLPSIKLDAERVLADVECLVECFTQECSLGLRIVDGAPYFFISARYGEASQSLWVSLKEGARNDAEFQRALVQCESLGYQPIAWEEKLRPFSRYFEDTALLQTDGLLAPKVGQLYDRIVEETANEQESRASITRFLNQSCHDEWIRILHRRESILVALTSPSNLPCVWDQLLISVNDIGKGVLAASIATCDKEAGADVYGKRGNVFRNALRSYVVEHTSWERWLENAVDSFKEHDRPAPNFPGAFGFFLRDALEAGVLRSLRTERIEPDFALGKRDIRETFTHRIKAAFSSCKVEVSGLEEEDAIFISNTAGERVYFFVNGYGIRELRVFPPNDGGIANDKCLLLKLEGRYQLDKYENVIRTLGDLFARGGFKSEHFLKDNDGKGISVGKGGFKVIEYLETLLQISSGTPAHRVRFFTVLNHLPKS